MQRRQLLIIAAIMAMFGFSSASAAKSQDNVSSGMIEALREMEAAWNRGDLAGFLDGYWNDPSFFFVSGSTASAGWDATRARYETVYPDPNAMGAVSFTDISTREISPDSGVLLCRWTLDFGDRQASGYATFLFERRDGVWRVTHEHASH